MKTLPKKTAGGQETSVAIDGAFLHRIDGEELVIEDLAELLGGWLWGSTGQAPTEVTRAQCQLAAAVALRSLSPAWRIVADQRAGEQYLEEKETDDEATSDRLTGAAGILSARTIIARRDQTLTLLEPLTSEERVALMAGGV